jgi:hypothetical protein
MAFPITLFFTQVDNLIPNRIAASEASDANVYQQIKQAVIDYSRIRPEVLIVDLTGDAGKYYAINTTNFPGYSESFSRIISIEYPAQAIADDQMPVYLGADDWIEDYYDASEVRYLFLPNHAPAATETMRIRFLGAYLWTASTTTTGSVTQMTHGFAVNDYIYKSAANTWVSAGSSANLLATHQVSAAPDANTFTAKVLQVDIPEMDFFAICNRAACIICGEIATHYSRTSDSTITLDSVNHTTRAQEFSKRAKELCGLWEAHLGIGKAAEEKSYLPASEFIDWDTAPGWPGGRRFIFHGGDIR